MAKISQERLNSIALRRLSTIGLTAAAGVDDILIGELTFAGLRHPVTGAPLLQSQFAVVSHDRLRLLEAPLQVLEPIAFYDVAGTAQLEARVQAALVSRMSAVKAVAEGFKRLRLSQTLDAERLTATATVSTTTAQLLLEASPEGVRVARLRLVGGQDLEVAADAGAIDLAEHEASIDLELALAALVPQLVRAAQSSTKTSTASSASNSTSSGAARVSAAPVAALTAVPIAGLPPLSFLLDKLGPMAVTSAELALDIRDGSDPDALRVLVAHKEGTLFRVRVFRHSEPQRPLWEDTVDFSRVARVLDVVATLLGRPIPSSGVEPSSGSGSQAAQADIGVPAHLAPHADEVWVMHVLVERDDEDETRYVTTDADGRPYGAARVLKRDVFRSVFTEQQGAWRLRILIEEVRGAQVLYRQLDSARQPGPEQRTMAMAHLIASFVPEASQY